MKYLCCLSLLLITALHAAELAPSARIEKFKLGDWEDEIGYRQAVRVGNTLHISGVTGSGAMPDAIRGVYGELQKILGHFGLTFADVVKENAYTTDLEALKAHLKVRRAYYGTEFPAATWVQVSRLYESSHVLEVELTAVFPDQPATGKH